MGKGEGIFNMNFDLVLQIIGCGAFLIAGILIISALFKPPSNDDY